MGSHAAGARAAETTDTLAQKTYSSMPAIGILLGSKKTKLQTLQTTCRQKTLQVQTAHARHRLHAELQRAH